ncbi:hypothetical protein BH23THE1_BH23THE1_06250 [soil metagenome]
MSFYKKLGLENSDGRQAGRVITNSLILTKIAFSQFLDIGLGFKME